MIKIRCINCGDEFELDNKLIPYEGDICCSCCETIMSAMIGAKDEISSLELKYPTFNELNKFKLNKLEKKSLNEAAIAFGSGAYTA